MAVVASGPISVNLAKLVDLVAGSETFRARVYSDGDGGMASEAEARLHIHHPHLTKQLGEIVYPAAVVQQAKGMTHQKFAGGGLNYHRPQGTLRLILSDQDRYPDDSQQSQVDFENFAGGVIADLLAVAGESDNLSILDVRQDGVCYMTKPMHVPSQKHALSLWMADWELDYGWA